MEPAALELIYKLKVKQLLEGCEKVVQPPLHLCSFPQHCRHINLLDAGGS